MPNQSFFDDTQEMYPPDNPGEYHVPAVLLLDCSSSMEGASIDELNEGLKIFGQTLREDPLALGRADIAIVTFNSTVNEIQPFIPASMYKAPVLKAQGLTSLNGAINRGLDMIRARKDYYAKVSGTKYYRPWLFVLTDGYPTDKELTAATQARLQKEIRNKGVFYLPMAIGNKANPKVLQDYYPPEAAQKPYFKAKATDFKQAFVFLSNSISQVSRTDLNGGDTIKSPQVDRTITIGI